MQTSKASSKFNGIGTQPLENSIEQHSYTSNELKITHRDFNTGFKQAVQFSNAKVHTWPGSLHPTHSLLDGTQRKTGDTFESKDAETLTKSQRQQLHVFKNAAQVARPLGPQRGVLCIR